MGRILLRVSGLLALLVLAGLATFYLVDGHPLPESAAFLASTDFQITQQADGGLLFTPLQSGGPGLLIMHGALIKPQSYAKTAAFFAARGYTVVLPYGGPSRLSIMAIDAAGESMRALEVSHWFTLGHSMGGMASLAVIAANPDLPIRAAALWAAAMPVDYSALQLPMLFLWGDNDGLLPASRLEAGKGYLPQNVEYVTLTDANHQDFAMYGHQFFDGESRLGWARQIDQANKRTLEFFARMTP